MKVPRFDRADEALIQLYKDTQQQILNQIYEVFDKVAAEGTWNWVQMNKYNQAQRLFNGITQTLNKMGAVETSTIEDALRHTYTHEYANMILNMYAELTNKSWEDIRKQFSLDKYEENYMDLLTDKNFSGIIKGTVNFIVPSEQFVTQCIKFPWSGDIFSDRLWHDKQLLINSVRQELTQSMILGESMNKAGKRIRDRMGAGSYNSLRVARTEIVRVLNVAHLNAYEQNGVTEMYWDSAYESNRTCEVCRTRDSESHKAPYKIEDAPVIPAHPHCRCRYMPVLETMEMPKRPDKTPDGKSMALNPDDPDA